MPEISIIVPVYNVEKYIRRCLDSILTQTFTDWECILVDDGSPDNSGMICDEYAAKDSRFKVIHKENGGQAIARNMALDIVIGEYIAFVDSDDCIHKNYLDTLYHNAVTHNAQISVCGYRDFTDNIPSDISVNTALTVSNGKDFLTHCFMDNIPKKPWVLWDKLWHRSCFENVRMPEGRINEDNAVVYKILYETQTIVDCSDEMYYYFYNTSGTVNQTFRKKNLDWLLVPQEMIEYFKEKKDKVLEDKANKIYLGALVDCYLKTQQYIGDKQILTELKDALQKQVNTEQKKYPITIETHPQIFEILHPTYSKLYWTKKGLSHKLKGK